MRRAHVVEFILLFNSATVLRLFSIKVLTIKNSADCSGVCGSHGRTTTSTGGRGPSARSSGERPTISSPRYLWLSQ